MSEPTCTGECCARFGFKDDDPRPRLVDVLAADPNDRDAAYILAMLVPIESEPGFFMCEHWDATSQLCTAYDERPKMCRDYPYDSICGFCGLVGPRCDDPATAALITPDRRQPRASVLEALGRPLVTYDFGSAPVTEDKLREAISP